MSERIPLAPDRATAFDEAFEKRLDYIRAEGLDLIVGGAERVPLPGCPQCGAPAVDYEWSTVCRDGEELVAELDVGPCGHRFSTLPVPERFLYPD